VRQFFLGLTAVVLLWESPLRAGTVLESATLGPTGQTIGVFVQSDQYLGARFQVTSTTVVDHIGGHLGANGIVGNGEILGAIVPVLDTPIGFPFSTKIAPVALAEVTFTLPATSEDLLLPLSVTLAPGSYALVFGSGEFGATGQGIMPEDNTDTAQASYFFGGGTTNVWNNGGFHNARFVVTGTVLTVPEPATLVLSGLAGLAALRGRLRRRGG
jgi:PEP-CTERM motif